MTRNPAWRPPSSWQATLDVTLTADGLRTRSDHRHQGPLRVLKTLFPEGDRIAHLVLVHPPGGIVGGDALRINISAGPDTHGVFTTPGATRFYRNHGVTASQALHVSVADKARLEWLPLENIVHDGAWASNNASFTLAPAASMIGWDLTCLGLPASAGLFEEGQWAQHLEVQGLWLERSTIKAGDTRLLHSRLGLAGRPVVATAWCAWGDAFGEATVDALLADAHAVVQAATSSDLTAWASAGQACLAAVTHAQPTVVVLRVLGYRVEPVFAMLRQVRAVWRKALWKLEAVEPRIWAS